MKAHAKQLLAACLVVVAGTASAHRFHAGITDVTHNPRSGSIEIVHTYMGHDIEPLVAGLAGRQADLTQPEDEAALRAYMEQHFYLLAADGKRLPAKWVGMSADADSVVVYQEVPATPLSAVARIHDSVLMDTLPGQQNTVNIATTPRATLSFDRSRQEQAVNTASR